MCYMQAHILGSMGDKTQDTLGRILHGCRHLQSINKKKIRKHYIISKQTTHQYLIFWNSSLLLREKIYSAFRSE
jgi:hypothetical protein